MRPTGANLHRFRETKTRLARAPAETGEVLRMREPYGEGVATHAGPESCVVDREVGGEALTGVRAGWAMSREIRALRKQALRGADALGEGGRLHQTYRNREVRLDPARSEDPMHVRKHLAREPGDPTSACRKRVRQAASGSPRT